MYLLAPFILQNLKKILRADPELWGCAIFRPKMTHSSWTIFFWYKPLLLLSFTYCSFSLCLISKNSYRRSRGFGPKWSSGSRVMSMLNFWAQNDPFPQWDFFRKPVNEACFFHSCLSTREKSKSDINLLVKYWRLKNTEISLAKSHIWL